MYKLIGSVLVFAGCGGLGISLASSHLRRERILLQICKILDEMECELRYRLTRLPELCALAAKGSTGYVKKVMTLFAGELKNRISPDPASCIAWVLDGYPVPDECIRELFMELGRSLGRFDLEGQLRGLCRVKELCVHRLEEERSGKSERIRCYRTIGFCAGAALVILLV